MKRLIPFLALLVCCQFVNGAGFKISELPETLTAKSTNLLPIVTSATDTSHIKVGNLLTNLLTQVVASTLYQGTNANLTGWAAIPATSQGVQNTLGQVYQATNANLTVLASNPSLYQATNAALTRLQGIGAGASGDVLFRDATGWTNLAKDTDGLVLKLTSGFPSWQSDNVAAGGFMSQTVSNNIVSSGLLAVDSTKTNAVAATAANVTSALGYTPQNGSANLTNWSALSTNELTALLTEAEASALYQATNANLTGWAGITATSQGIQNTLGQVYQATNAALTALASNPAMYQATNANLTTLSTGDGSFLTSTGATNQNQLVTLEQLEGAVRGGVVAFFDTQGSSAANGFTLTGTVKATNYTALVTPPQWTNNAVTSANGDYIAAFITTNTYSRLASGLGVVEVYAFENEAGSGSVSAEIYIINDTTSEEEYEFTPSPAYQTVAAGTAPTKLTFSIPVTDYYTGTNFHLMVKIKVQESGVDPTIRIVTGGIYPSHLSFAVPAGDIVSYNAVTNALALTGSTTTFLRSDGTQATPADGTANWTASGTTNSTLTGTARIDSLVVTNDISAASVDLTGDLSAGTLYLSGLVPGYVELDANTNMVNVSAGEQTMFSRLGGIGAGASGDILYRDATGWTNLVKGADGKYLKLVSGLPSWETATGGTSNWTDSGTTNATLSGIAQVHGLNATNSLSIGGTAVTTATTTDTFTNKTLDAAGTGNVLKQTKYMMLMRPDWGDGAGAVPQTNTFTASGLMHYTFSGNAETNANYVVYETVVPPDIDTSVAMTATFAFVPTGDDTDTVTFHIAYGLGVAESAYPVALANIATSPLAFGAVTPPASATGKYLTTSALTLTGWAASMTAGTPLLISVRRIQDSNDAGQRDLYLRIAYGSTQ